MKKNKKIIVFALIILSNVLFFSLGRLSSENAKGVSNENSLDIEQQKKLIYLENYIKKNYLNEFKKEDLYTGQLKGMVKALDDPYSEYLTASELDSLLQDTSGKFFGIGVYIGMEDGRVTIISPIKNTPAEKAGLKPGDKILKVDGKSLDNESISKASELIKGKKGTEVSLTILRERKDGPQTFDVVVKRDEITVTTVESEKKDNILYVSISQFKEDTSEEFRKALDNIDDNTTGMILDLRSNPGGLLNVCKDVADMLLPEGLIYYTKNKDGVITEKGQSDSNEINIPIVVLINNGTASASEVVTGALRDYNKATIVGEKSYGKGVVQSINKISNNEGIKLTIAEYFTPNGVVINKKGIKPDVEVKLNEDVKKIGIDNLENDNQLQKAFEILKSN